MNKKIRTCVITVNYYGAKDTFNCVESLKKSLSPVLIVVVDNTPEDPELEAALSTFKDVHLIRAPENLGFGGGNNLGIEWALKNTSCEFLFIFNNDATVSEDAILKLEQAMDEHPEAGVVASRIVMQDDPNLLWYGGGSVDWRRGAAIAPGILGSSSSVDALESKFVGFATGCAMLIRKSVIEKVGGFDDRFFMYEEDLELSLRILDSGYKIWYESNSLVYHVGQGSTRDSHEFMSLWSPRNPKLVFYVYHIVKNRLLNATMHARGRDALKFWFYFPLLCMYKMMQFVTAGRFDGAKALFLAVVHFVRDYKQ